MRRRCVTSDVAQPIYHVDDSSVQSPGSPSIADALRNASRFILRINGASTRTRRLLTLSRSA